MATLLRECNMEKEVELVLRGQLSELNLELREGGGDEGAKIVAAFLKHDKTCKKVNLNGWNIEWRGGRAIADALKHNSTVRDLSISFNPIGEVGVEAFIASLDHNVCISNLWLPSSSTTAESAATIEYLIEIRNRILIPDVVRRASLCLIAFRRTIAGAGNLAVCPKEIVKMVAMQVWATRKDPQWLDVLSQAERTGKSDD